MIRLACSDLLDFVERESVQILDQSLEPVSSRLHPDIGIARVVLRLLDINLPLSAQEFVREVAVKDHSSLSEPAKERNTDGQLVHEIDVERSDGFQAGLKRRRSWNQEEQAYDRIEVVEKGEER
jgi:hypothetical protein